MFVFYIFYISTLGILTVILTDTLLLWIFFLRLSFLLSLILVHTVRIYWTWVHKMFAIRYFRFILVSSPYCHFSPSRQKRWVYHANRMIHGKYIRKPLICIFIDLQTFHIYYQSDVCYHIWFVGILLQHDKKLHFTYTLKA